VLEGLPGADDVVVGFDRSAGGLVGLARRVEPNKVGVGGAALALDD